MLLICTGAFLNAQVTSDFTLTANPIVNIPMGPSLSDGTPFYSLGGGLSLKGEYSPPFARPFYAGLVFDADFLPINASTKAVTLLSLGPEIGIQLYPIPRLGFRLAGYGGYYAGMIQAGSVIDPFAGALFDVSYLVSTSFSVGAGASFKYYFTPTTAVYQGIGVNLGVQYHIGAGGGGYVHVEPQILPIFPLFYSFYDKNPAGSLTIKNTSSSNLQDVEVSFLVKQFMEQPKVSWRSGEMRPGEEKKIPVFALFSDSILQVTEATKVAGEIIVTYKYLGNEVPNHYPVTVTVNNRNAMTWDDTDKAAAFVTSNDTNVRSLSARAVPDARSRGKPAINATFRSAMALFMAMNVHGVAYLPDPSVSFADKISNKIGIDYLQFPAQTLDIRAGDCDDLSILYAALLESAAIESAFITVPGHIYVAFNTQMDAQTAKGTFAQPDDLIIRDGEAWIPVEITRVKDGFLKAWRTGAQEWRAAQAGKAADFRPIRQGWLTYAPANTGDRLRISVTPPDSNRVYAAYSRELDLLYASDFQPRIEKILGDLKTSKDPKLLNRLGILYARFGMLDEAQKQFELVIKQWGDLASALINLGNLAYINGDNDKAMNYFTRALAKSPQSSTALQGVAMAGYQLGDTQAVDKALAQLKAQDPQAINRLAAQGIGASGASRAASAEKELDTWNEE